MKKRNLEQTNWDQERQLMRIKETGVHQILGKPSIYNANSIYSHVVCIM